MRDIEPLDKLESQTAIMDSLELPLTLTSTASLITRKYQIHLNS